jgi:hypothetical protein
VTTGIPAGGESYRHRDRSSGVQEFRSSGVQEFRSSGVQEFRSSGVQELQKTKPDDSNVKL